MLMLSFAFKSGLASYLLTDEGVEKHKCTYRLEKDKCQQYDALIDIFKSSVKYLNSYLDDSKSNTTIVFECNCSVFIKWVNQGYSAGKYNKDFAEALALLDDLPVSYCFVLNKRPYARAYLSEQYIAKPKLSSFDFVNDISEEEEE